MKLNKTKTVLITGILMAILLCLVIFSADAKLGAKDGIALCENVIIPALLPVLIVTNIVINTNCRRLFEKAFGFITVKLFRLPRCATSAIIFGLIGGYPAGALLTNQLFINKMIDENQARRIMRFNFCGGVAFVITAVGTITMKSTAYGIVLYAINVIASIIIGIVSALFYPKIKPNGQITSYPLTLSQAIVQSVEQTVKSLLIMSGYIIMFSAISIMVDLPQELTPLLEITNGICRTKKHFSLNMIASFLSFGGLCIHLQLMGVLNNIKMKYYDFLIWRIVSALLSSGLGYLYLLLFPESISVFSNMSQPTPQLFQVNTGFSLIMILGCIVLIFDIEGRKKYHSAI